ncbi:MAG: ComEA family DNA-binding protein [Clostridiaceae bacterium]|nr:ComEA family DNA-binding protein [Clostridiaceae bacterium]
MKNKEKIIGSVIILVLFLIFLLIGYNITNNKSDKSKKQDIFVQEDSLPTNAEDPKKTTNTNNKIRVEIKGAVKSPDVYTLDSGNIVLDLVKASGGYNVDADKDSIIQSTKLNDGDCIWVKKKEDTNSSSNIMPTSIIQSTNLNRKVNLNTANKEELMKLDGIGEARADKIIEYREKNGPYKAIEDLKKVGARIGDSIIKNIKDKADIK